MEKNMLRTSTAVCWAKVPQPVQKPQKLPLRWALSANRRQLNRNLRSSPHVVRQVVLPLSRWLQSEPLPAGRRTRQPQVPVPLETEWTVHQFDQPTQLLV